MTPAEFQKKWAAYSGKESSAYQEHFNDLCRLLGHPSPAAADPTGEEDFCFQKYVLKDSELLGLVAEAPLRRGFADVWKRNAFAWEYKGKDRDLDAAVAAAYAWPPDLPEPEVLTRLLALNLARAKTQSTTPAVVRSGLSGLAGARRCGAPEFCGVRG